LNPPFGSADEAFEFVEVRAADLACAEQVTHGTGETALKEPLDDVIRHALADLLGIDGGVVEEGAAFFAVGDEAADFHFAQPAHGP
jgi:hypothetical protein